jgi:alkaline phosphatase
MSSIRNSLHFFLGVTVLSFAFIVSSCSSKSNQLSEADINPRYEFKEGKKPDNIIFLIGDGMGLSQITGALYTNGTLNLERFVDIGLMKTDCEDQLITDSAAGATAFATGKKTYAGAISVDSDSAELKTIIEELEEREFRTGLIATASITHATPACFAAHATSRYKYEEIAEDLANSEVDLLIGGGQKYFEARKDGKDLISKMKERGYSVFVDNEEYQIVSYDKLLVFTSAGEPEKISEGRDPKYLNRAFRTAVKSLIKPNKKFFLMIEGSQIDWGGHANDMEYIISELLDFDQLIGEVLDHVDSHPNTLVVVTADHETGGFAINGGSLESRQLESGFTTKKHTATMVPVFAYGPGSELFRGVFDNTEIYHKMKALLE